MDKEKFQNVGIERVVMDFVRFCQDSSVREGVNGGLEFREMREIRISKGDGDDETALFFPYSVDFHAYYCDGGAEYNLNVDGSKTPILTITASKNGSKIWGFYKSKDMPKAWRDAIEKVEIEVSGEGMELKDKQEIENIAQRLKDIQSAAIGGDISTSQVVARLLDATIDLAQRSAQ